MAAPTVGAVMADILPYLGVEQKFSEEDIQGKSVALEDLTGLTEQEATKMLKDQSLNFRKVGEGETVTTSAITSPMTERSLLLFFIDHPQPSVNVHGYGAPAVAERARAVEVGFA